MGSVEGVSRIVNKQTNKEVLNMHAHDFIKKIVEHAEDINKTLVEFLQTEQVTGANTLDTAKITAYDIIYKYMLVAYKNDNREASKALPDKCFWQASDLTVFEKAEAKVAVLKLEDYKYQISRTGRVGEDRTGYIPLAEKTAAELGFTTPKAAAL